MFKSENQTKMSTEKNYPRFLDFPKFYKEILEHKHFLRNQHFVIYNNYCYVCGNTAAYLCF